MENEKPYAKMTRKELIDMIRKSTIEVNERVQEYRQDGEKFKDVESAIRLMKELSGVQKGRELEIGVGRLASKNKPALIRQARELNAFLRWDIYTPQGKRQLEAREKKEWESFHETYPEWNYEQWREMVEDFGAVGKAVVDEFDSNSVRALLKEQFGKNKRITNLASKMDAIHNKAKKDTTKAWTKEDMINELRKEILKDLEDIEESEE